jgi:hypothetical protein
LITRLALPGQLGGIALAALVTSLALAACGSVKETMLARGFPPAYADGCSSGSAAAGGLFEEPRKDMTRYGTDRQYTEGWDAGFQQCRRETEATVKWDRLASGSSDNSRH